MAFDVKNPGNKRPYNTLYAILSVDRNGNEGIPLVSGPYGPVLAVTGDLGVLQAYEKMLSEPAVKKEAAKYGMKMVVAMFIRNRGSDRLL